MYAFICVLVVFGNVSSCSCDDLCVCVCNVLLQYDICVFVHAMVAINSQASKGIDDD